MSTQYVASTTEITYDVQELLASIFVFFRAAKPNILKSTLNYTQNNSDGNLLVLHRDEKTNIILDQTTGEVTVVSFDVEPTQNDEALDYFVDQETGELIYDET